MGANARALGETKVSVQRLAMQINCRTLPTRGECRRLGGQRGPRDARNVFDLGNRHARGTSFSASERAHCPTHGCTVRGSRTDAPRSPSILTSANVLGSVDAARLGPTLERLIRDRPPSPRDRQLRRHHQQRRGREVRRASISINARAPTASLNSAHAGTDGSYISAPLQSFAA